MFKFKYITMFRCNQHSLKKIPEYLTSSQQTIPSTAGQPKHTLSWLQTIRKSEIIKKTTERWLCRRRRKWSDPPPKQFQVQSPVVSHFCLIYYQVAKVFLFCKLLIVIVISAYYLNGWFRKRFSLSNSLPFHHSYSTVLPRLLHVFTWCGALWAHVKS